VTRLDYKDGARDGANFGFWAGVLSSVVFLLVLATILWARGGLVFGTPTPEKLVVRYPSGPHHTSVACLDYNTSEYVQTVCGELFVSYEPRIKWGPDKIPTIRVGAHTPKTIDFHLGKGKYPILRDNRIMLELAGGRYLLHHQKNGSIRLSADVTEERGK